MALCNPMVLLVPVLECLKQTCSFMVCRLCPFSQTLGSIPLKCAYLCSLTYIISILEKNSDRLFFFSLLKASESHNVHLLCFFQVCQQVMRKSVSHHYTRQGNAARNSGPLSCWHCQSDFMLALCLCPVINPWSPHSFTNPVPH